MAYLRDNKEMSIKALIARHTEALGTLRSSQSKGEKSAGYVWNKIAGHIGRKHTLGLYLEEPKEESSTCAPNKNTSIPPVETGSPSNNRKKVVSPRSPSGKVFSEKDNTLSRIKPSHKRLPILHVYLDSQALIQDFSTDVALYQAKMAHEGLPVQSIKFHLSKKTQEKDNHAKETKEAAWILRNNKRVRLTPSDVKKTNPFNELPPLSPTDIQFIQQNVKTLPADLKRSVISAMSARLRRQKDV